MEKINTIYRYHQQTSYERGKMAGHQLDWQNQPSVYKEYNGIDHIPLPDNMPSMPQDIYKVLKKSDSTQGLPRMDPEQLSVILRLTCTFTARASQGGDFFYYRSAASAGALYPTEIYIVTHGFKGLNNGLYHFGIHGHRLTPLRDGDLSGFIAGHLIPPSSVLPVIAFIFTSIYFRSSWKYRERAYRYHLLDTGHVMENISIAIKALGLPVRISYDFNDKNVNRLAGLDDQKEASLALAYIPGFKSAADSCMPMINVLPGDIKNASTVSEMEIQYPAILAIHKAGRPVTMDSNHMNDVSDFIGPLPEIWTTLPDSPPGEETVSYPDCLFKRRSRRNFINVQMERNTLLALLDALCPDDTSIPQTRSGYSHSFCTGFITGNIKGVDQGIYILDREQRRFGLVKRGSFIERMAHACLDQLWLKNANIHFLFYSDLDYIEQRWGPRGYRYAMMGAGRMGERIYILATALGLGCCGIGAFYDQEAADIIGLNKSSRLLYLVAAGSTSPHPEY
jgi:SagB-type dehydrogenase family enzyme